MRETSGYSGRIGDFIGSLFLVACLLLLSSGVSVVRADEAQGDVTAPAPSETAAAVKPANPAAQQDVVERPSKPSDPLEGAPRPERPGTPGPGGGIVLNTRGYNYGPDRPTYQPQSAPPAAAQPSSPPAQPEPSAP